MPTVKYKKKLSSDCREKIRDEVTDWFLQEKPGKGRGDLASRAVYEVEEYGDLAIELYRPAVLNKGFDFVVQIKGLHFKNKKRSSSPSHNDMFVILESFKKENSEIYRQKIIGILNDIYKCKPVRLDSKVSMGYFIDCDGNKHPIEIALLCIKWLFIEQDITYWNWSGRNKLYETMREKGLM